MPPSLSSSDSHVSGTPPPSPLAPLIFDAIEEYIDCTLPPPTWTPPEHSRPLLPSPAQEIESKKTHSTTAEALLGASIPHNTKRCNQNALRALISFCIKKSRPFRSFLLRRDDMSQALNETRCFLFPGDNGDYLPFGYTDWTEAQLKHIRYYLIEFVANYKNTRTGTDIAPSTLKTYILSIQRAFKAEWGYDIHLLSGPIFNSPTEGLFSTLDNKAREQKRAGMHVVSHNVLSPDDLRILYSSPSLSKSTAKGFQTRLVFTIGIFTAMRPSALANLSVTQFRKTKIKEDTVWIIASAMGSTTGALKTARGGWAATGNKVPEIPVWDEEYENRSINFYQDIDEYTMLRFNLEVGTDLFFLAIHPNAVRRQDFFKRQHMGKNTFMSIVKTACKNEGIQGEDKKNWVTTHSLRGTLATLLFQNGHSDSSVALRTGHRDPKSLKSYQNLEGIEGIQQQRDLFRTEGSRCKRLKVNEEDQENKSTVTRETGESRTPFTSIGNVTGGTVNVTVNCYVQSKQE